MTVYNFGSINLDLVYRVPHLVRPGETLASSGLQKVLGGKGANQSVALARAGADVRHIGRINEADTWVRDELAQAGVDISSVIACEGSSGHAIIQVDDAGENSIILHGGVNQEFEYEQLRSALGQASSGDWLLMQNECNGIDLAFDLAEELGLNIALNPAPMHESISQLALENCALLIVNETEAAELAGTCDMQAALQELNRRYPETRIVLTLGAEGAKLRHGATAIDAAGLTVEAVDTTGAGDTFVGYFLSGLINQNDDKSALQRACAAAALSVTRQGATPSIPTAAQVDDFVVLS